MGGDEHSRPSTQNDNNKNLVLLYVYYPTNCCGSVIPHSGTILAFGAGQTTVIHNRFGSAPCVRAGIYGTTHMRKLDPYSP